MSLTPNGYTEAEETYALRLYDTDLVGGGGGGATTAKLNSQSAFLRHALASVQDPGNLPQRIMDLYFDKTRYQRTAGEIELRVDDVGDPFKTYDENLRYILMHARHYGRLAMPRKVSTGAAPFAESGTLALSISMDWFESSLSAGYTPYAETRVVCRRRSNDADGGGGGGSNIIDLLFDSALTGLAGTDSTVNVLQLREVVPANLFNVRVFDAQNKLIRPVPTIIQVHVSPAFGSAMLFEVDFSVTPEIGKLFATTEARVSWAAMFATRVLGYLSIIRVLNAGALACATSFVIGAEMFYDSWTLFKKLAAKVSSEIGPTPEQSSSATSGANQPRKILFHLLGQLRSNDDAGVEFANQADGVVTAQLGQVLLHDIKLAPDVKVDSADPARRISERRQVIRNVDARQESTLREWRKKIATNLGMKDEAAEVASPSTIVDYAQRTMTSTALYADIYNFPKHTMDALIWAATETASKYPPELSAPASPDDERMLRVLQERSEAALRNTFRYLGETIAVVFANCVTNVVEAAPLVDLLHNLTVGDDDLGRSALLYIIGLLEVSRAPNMPASIALPGGETLAATIKRLGVCVDAEGKLAQSILTKANAPMVVVKEYTGDRERLQKLALANQLTENDLALASNFVNAAGFFKNAIERLKKLVGIVDSNTLWRSGLQKLPLLTSYYAKDIVEHVPAALAQLQTAILAQAGLARELSNRLRLFVEDAARLAKSLEAKETKEMERIKFELDLLAPLRGPDAASMEEDTKQRKRRYDDADHPIPDTVRAVVNAEVDEELEHAKFARQLKQYATEAEAAQNQAFYEAVAQTRTYKRAQLEAERDLWVRRKKPTAMVIETIDNIRKLESVANTKRSISRENNTLVLLHLESALQLVRGGRLTVPGAGGGGGGLVAAPVIGGDEARRFFSAVVVALENAHTLSESLELFYAEGRKALDKIRALDAQLRPDEEAMLIEQMELNRQIENDVIAGHVDLALRLALFAANLDPAVPSLVSRISETRIALVTQKASLDSTTLVAYAARLLASLRETSQAYALAESRMEQRLTGQVAAITHLGIAGYIMEGELALARWQKQSDADLERLEASLRTAEELLARRMLASLLASIRRGDFAATGALQLFDEYRALLESIAGTTKIDYVPIPTPLILDQFASGGGMTPATAAIIENLKRYDALQREYYGEVVVREPLSKTYEERAFVGKQQLPLDAQTSIRDRMKTVGDILRRADRVLNTTFQGAGFLNVIGKSWYDENVLGRALSVNHTTLLNNLDDINAKATDTSVRMKEDDPREPVLTTLQRNSADIYKDLRLVISSIDVLFSQAVFYLSSQSVSMSRNTDVDGLFRALRVVQEEAAALLKQYFATDVKLPTADARELPWKVVDLATLDNTFQQTLRSLGLSS